MCLFNRSVLKYVCVHKGGRMLYGWSSWITLAPLYEHFLSQLTSIYEVDHFSLGK